MAFKVGVVLLILSLLQLIITVAPYDVEITPDHLRLSEESNTVAVSCSAGVPLTGCQFRWWDFYGEEGPLVDLSLGALSRADSAHLTEALTNYTYSGRGLKAGDCGLTLQVEGWRAWMVSCRVQAENGAWTYKWMDLYAQGWGALPTFVTPKEAVAMPGGLARFLLLSKEPLGFCNYFLPETGLLQFDQGPESANSTGSHLYHGSGLRIGECGLSVSNVSEEHNGIVRVWAATVNETAADTRLMALIVARAPSQPIMRTAHEERKNTTVTCRVDGARPMPTVTWTLGEKVIRQDSVNDLRGRIEDAWMWPWMEGTMEQTVELNLQDQDYGKTIKCSYSHMTLKRPLEHTQILIMI